MAIELHHLHPGHDDEVARLKARIAELERMDTEHTVQIAKMNGYIHHLEEELEASKRKEKESRQPRKLQGDEMKTLTLSLKKQWFDMIKSGEKKEEYRELKPFWEKRLVDYKAIIADAQALAFKRYVLRIPYDVCKDYPRGYDTLVFTLGYPKADDAERRLTFKNPKIRIDEGKPEWGAEPGKLYFVITWEE